MATWKKFVGTIESYLRISLTGPRLKDNAGTLQIRNSDDSAFAKIQCAAPTTDDDVVNFKYFTSYKGNVIVGRQADCSVAVPNNTAARGYVVVTTAGSGTVIGDLLFDDGSSVGTMEIIGKLEGRTIAITDSLSGGTISFDTDSIYCWDEDGSVWVKIGDIGSVTGAEREIRYVIDNSATQDSTTATPVSNRVTYCALEVTTPYSGGATIQVGDTGTANKFMGTGDNNPQAAATYVVEQDTVTIASVIRTAVGGAPAAGAGIVVVRFTSPLA